MSNSTNKAAVFITAGNGAVEIVPINAIRKLVATATQRMLFVTDEHNQPAMYLLDTKEFEDRYVEEYGKDENEEKHLADVSASVYRAILEGKTFTVVSRHFKEEKA